MATNLMPQLHPCKDCGHFPQFTHVGLVYRCYCMCGSGPSGGERWKRDAAIWWNRYCGTKPADAAIAKEKEAQHA